MQLLYVSHADTTLSRVPLTAVTACVTSSASLSASFTWQVTRWESSAGNGRVSGGSVLRFKNKRRKVSSEMKQGFCAYGTISHTLIPSAALLV